MVVGHFKGEGDKFIKAALKQHNSYYIAIVICPTPMNSVTHIPGPAESWDFQRGTAVKRAFRNGAVWHRQIRRLAGETGGNTTGRLTVRRT